MNMKFDINKDKGRAGLAAAIQYYTFQGHTVSIPLNDTQYYDLIVDKDGQLCKIQVKATGQKSRYGWPIVSVKSCGGTKGTPYQYLKDTDIDFLFVLTGDQQMYEIPKSEITASTSLNLGPDRQKYRIDI